MELDTTGESLPTENTEETQQEDQPPYTINQIRFDPYKNFKFIVKWDGKVVAGLSKMTPLRRTTQVVEHREGNDPNSIGKSPGVTRYEPLILERGITEDLEFENWARKVWNFDPSKSLKDFRKDITIELLNAAGQVAIIYKVYRCWVSEYEALPGLDSNANAVAIERIKIENEGWERDK